MWGILSGVFNSIPYFGPIIVSGGLLLVGLVQSGDPTHAIRISAAALVITALEGWGADPAADGQGRAYARGCRVPGRSVVDVDLGRMGHDPCRSNAGDREVGCRPRRIAEAAEPANGSVTD